MISVPGDRVIYYEEESVPSYVKERTFFLCYTSSEGGRDGFGGMRRR